MPRSTDERQHEPTTRLIAGYAASADSYARLRAPVIGRSSRRPRSGGWFGATVWATRRVTAAEQPFSDLLDRPAPRRSRPTTAALTGS
jgi:hypothetical protein